MCTSIAIQIYNLCVVLDLDRIAIGGGISRQPIVTEKIKEKFQETTNRSVAVKYGFNIKVEIVPCYFYNDANLIGAFLTYQKMVSSAWHTM